MTNSKTISVIVAGINGRMGRCTVQALRADKSIRLVGAFGRTGAAYAGKTVAQLFANEANLGNDKEAKISDSLEKCLANAKEKPDILIDFTEAHSAVKHALTALAQGIKPIIGASGLTEEHFVELKEACKKTKLGALVVPNFSVGAVLMINFAKQASKFFNNAEIVETHKLGKLDAPSGTAMYTGRAMSQAKNLDGTKSDPLFNANTTKETELLVGARGGKLESGIHIHSLRLPGILSKQDVYFAGEGELLTLRHESHNTKCFEQGIVLAIKSTQELDTFMLGLDNIIEKLAIQ